VGAGIPFPQCCLYAVDKEPLPEGLLEEIKGCSFDFWQGDQASKAFWRRFKAQVKSLDIVIDDGGHTYEQQVTTLEELWPIVSVNGVYIVEDLHNSFRADGPPFRQSTWRALKERLDSLNSGKQMVSYHFYNGLVVIEKSPTVIERPQKWGTSSRQKSA
jgi:hypothetical protein